jgi:hypothetical protein
VQITSSAVSLAVDDVPRLLLITDPNGLVYELVEWSNPAG